MAVLTVKCMGSSLSLEQGVKPVVQGEPRQAENTDAGLMARKTELGSSVYCCSCFPHTKHIGITQGRWKYRD